MATLKPDPTFYPSPRLAAEAPREELAYFVTLNTSTNGNGQPDALTVIDLNPESTTYGRQINRLEMPNAGDELSSRRSAGALRRQPPGRVVTGRYKPYPEAIPGGKAADYPLVLLHRRSARQVVRSSVGRLPRRGTES